MKLQRNLDAFFTVLFIVTVLLSPFWGPGIKGQDWMRTYAPYVRFFLALSYIGLGPWFMSSALKDRDSEKTMTVWKKAWPVTFGFGVVSLLTGIAGLWFVLFVK